MGKCLVQWTVLTQEALTEIEKLKVHMAKGCLSGIGVGGGTNNNEAFHRYVNSFFHKSRIGVMLAYAMMMTIISHFNNNDKHSRRAIFRPISTIRYEGGASLEKMGIIMNIDRNSDDITWMQDETQDDIDPSLIDSILSVSLSQFTIYKEMKKVKTSTHLWKYVPYIQVLPQRVVSEDNEVDAHRERLQNNAKAWNFSIIPVSPDGNCFFMSVALALVQNIDQSKPILNQIEVNTSGSIQMLSSKLREVIVKEWLGPHRSRV